MWRAEKVRWGRRWTRAKRSERTFHDYLLRYEAYQRWCAKQGLDTASLDSADDYIAHVESSSVHAARKAAQAIRSYGEYLAAQYETPNPFARLAVPPEPKPQKAPTASDADLQALLATCKPTRSWYHLRDKAIILVLAGSGMRRAEVAGMRLDEVNLGTATAVVPFTKNGERRTVYLTDEAVTAIMQYLRASQDDRGERPELWMALGGQALTADGLGQMMGKREKAAGVTLGAHSFRRRHAGKWMAAGGSQAGLATHNGWSPGTATEMILRYTKDTKTANALAEAERLFG